LRYDGGANSSSSVSTAMRWRWTAIPEKSSGTIPDEVRLRDAAARRDRLIVSTNGYIYCLDPLTGQILWNNPCADTHWEPRRRWFGARTSSQSLIEQAAAAEAAKKSHGDTHPSGGILKRYRLAAALPLSFRRSREGGERGIQEARRACCKSADGYNAPLNTLCITGGRVN